MCCPMQILSNLFYRFTQKNKKTSFIVATGKQESFLYN